MLVVGPECDDVAIQAAVDCAAAAGGGVVEIPPGIYEMHDSLHLRSGVTVRGSGPGTVLRKAASVRSALSADLGYGHYDVSLAEPDKFRVGMGVHIHDDGAGGFYDTVATLTWRDGDRFGISRMLNHDYSRGRNGVVTSVFPVISGYHLKGAVVEDLAVDGNRAENAYLNGCRGGGIFLLQAHDVVLRGLAIRDYHGDGISFQQCLRTRIEDCLLEGNAGHGLHPGSGSVAPVMRRCRCRSNGADGIFYCLRVSYSLCEECEIAGSGHDGISIGGRDAHHLIRGNRVTGSGRHAVYFRAGDMVMGGNDNRLEGNEFSGNCLHEGDAEVLVDDETARAQLVGNRYARGAGRSTVGVRVGDRCRDILVAESEFDAGFDRAVEAPNQGALVEGPAEPLLAGPECVPEGWVRHLGLEDPVLQPLRTFRGRLPEGWKDAIYEP